MRRLFNAHIQLAYEDKQVSASVNSPVASRTGFWWNERTPGERLEWGSKIELGEKFFQEIIRHPVPMDLNILKALKRSSLGLDLYSVVDVSRTFTLQAPATALLGASLPPVRCRIQPGSGGLGTINNFRTDCLRELKSRSRWHGPSLGYSTAQGVLILWPSKPAIPLDNSFRLWNSRRRAFSGSESPLKTLGVRRYPGRSENALRASEAMFIHKDLSSEGVFHDQTPGFGAQSFDQTPGHSYS